MNFNESGYKKTGDKGGYGAAVSRFRFVALALSFAVLSAALLLTFAKVVFCRRYRSQTESAAREFGLETAEVYAVIKAESGFDENAVSSAGARGLMQLLPSTAKFCAEILGEKYDDDLLCPTVNIRYGCCYLRYLKDRFDGGDVYAAYNAGEYRVRQWKESGVGIEYKETADYVKKVSAYKKIYSFLYGA